MTINITMDDNSAMIIGWGMFFAFLIWCMKFYKEDEYDRWPGEEDDEYDDMYGNNNYN